MPLAKKAAKNDISKSTSSTFLTQRKLFESEKKQSNFTASTVIISLGSTYTQKLGDKH